MKQPRHALELLNPEKANAPSATAEVSHEQAKVV
jgi:hypothetical protein